MTDTEEPVNLPAKGVGAMPITWRRFAGRAIDGVLIGAPALGLGQFLASDGSSDTEKFRAGAMVAFVALFIYEAVMVARFERTVGKMVFGTKVVMVDESPVRWAPAIRRSAIGWVITLAVYMITGLGPMVAVFIYGSAMMTPNRQGLPDRYAQTLVVNA